MTCGLLLEMAVRKREGDQVPLCSGDLVRECLVFAVGFFRVRWLELRILDLAIK